MPLVAPLVVGVACDTTCGRGVVKRFDVARGILMFERVNVPVLGIIENMSYFVCDNCDKKHFLFGNSAGALKDRFGLDTLAQFPMVDGISSVASPDAGADIESVQTLTENVHRAVGKNRIQKTELPQVSAEPGHIVVQWPDGNVDKLPNKEVRGACQCALCVEEFTGEQLLDTATIASDIEATSIDPLGNYAVGIAWNDGHSSGIFSWERLKEIAQGAAAG